jgi:hypothetical protein
VIALQEVDAAAGVAADRSPLLGVHHVNETVSEAARLYWGVGSGAAKRWSALLGGPASGNGLSVGPAFTPLPFWIALSDP